jgi:methionine-rich copper-binding protein CopC
MLKRPSQKGNRPVPRLIAVLRAAAAAALLGGLAHGSPAAAHAIVVGSSPAVGETLSLTRGGATADALVAVTRTLPGLPVEIRFNSRLDKARSRLALVGPDGVETDLDLSADGAPERLQARIRPTRPGAYTLRWRVLAVDGHITRGDIPFKISAD